MINITLDAKIESVLFFKSEPVQIKALVKILGVKETEIQDALQTLEEKLEGRGVQLLKKEDEVELRTASEMSDFIEQIRKEELTKDIGKAGSETLSIILYKGACARSEIDYIRGVNSTFILRNLLIRGLIEKTPNPKNQRSFLYKPTIELMSFLGINKIENLPDFDAVKKELETFNNQEEQEHVG